MLFPRAGQTSCLSNTLQSLHAAAIHQHTSPYIYKVMAYTLTLIMHLHEGHLS